MTRRIWTTAIAAAGPAGHRIQLDGRDLRLPTGAVLCIAGAALAGAVAQEWQDTPDPFTPADMPLTGLAGSAQERIAPHRDAMVATLAGYAQTDLLCYRATPGRLADLQAASWQPWLDWSATTFGAPLRVAGTLAHIAQPPDSLARLAAALAVRSNEDLAALGLAIPLLGSCVLGLALAMGAMDAATAASLSLLDELFQADRWGVDQEAADRRAAIGRDLAAAGCFMALAKAVNKKL